MSVLVQQLNIERMDDLIVSVWSQPMGMCEDCFVPLVEVSGEIVCVVCDDFTGHEMELALAIWDAEYNQRESEEADAV
jgi:hypothetical protein